jgi:Tol biopolymer transport system component
MAGTRTTGYGGTYDFLDPVWAPDGDRFAYFTLNDVAGAPDGNGMRVHVARFTDGTAEGPGDGEAADDTIIEFDPEADDEGWPRWSPDGSRIAFRTIDQGLTRLVIMPVEPGGTAASGPAVVTEGFYELDLGGFGYAWAPDGTALVLKTTGVGLQPNAYLVDAGTGELTQLGWRTNEWPSWQGVPG